jgi:hypothetical protein
MDIRLSADPLMHAEADMPSASFSLAAGVASIAWVVLAGTVAIYALAFLVPAWPWLSGAVTVPWDAKSQFFPQVQFLASSIARGEWPWWTPNVFAGWPEICDPQSLMFSPLHVLLAALKPAISLRGFDAVTFAYLFLGGTAIILFFHDRGWHAGGAVVAALAFALGGSASGRLQHTGQVVSLVYLPIAIWLVARALDRSSWRTGVAAGVIAGLLATGRDQVALISLYVVAGYVLYHWLAGDSVLARLRASIKPLAATGIAAFLVAAVPVAMSALLAARSNRPEISLAAAEGGSIHPVHLLQFVFADLYAGMNPTVEYWAPQSEIWDTAWGWPGLYLSQNMALIYAGAIPVVVVIAFGLIRGLAWARDIRYFTIAAALVLLYTLGRYTPVFHGMYDLLPGVALYRRPADATFVLMALVAVMAGYLVHRWLTGTVPEATRLQQRIEIACPIVLILAAFAVGYFVVGLRPVVVPVVTALVFTAAAIGVLVLARRVNGLSPIAAVALLAAFMAVDLRWNNAPHISTALPRDEFNALRQGTDDETVRLLKSLLVAGPQRRDRVELIGIAYHWPNLSLAQGFEHVFGHNPLRLRWFYDATHVGDTVAIPEQRSFSPFYPSYRSPVADLFGVRFVATGVPVEEIDSSLKPGDLAFVGRTEHAYVYENPRALPRAMVLTDWLLADFDEVLNGGWPSGVEPRKTVLLKKAPAGFTRGALGGVTGNAWITRYTNTDITIVADAPAGGGIVLLNDVWHPWWRASVDGEPAEILKANAIFRAVVIPSGRHRVQFTFHPFAGAWTELWAKLAHRRER